MKVVCTCLSKEVNQKHSQRRLSCYRTAHQSQSLSLPDEASFDLNEWGTKAHAREKKEPIWAWALVHWPLADLKLKFLAIEKSNNRDEQSRILNKGGTRPRPAGLYCYSKEKGLWRWMPVDQGGAGANENRTLLTKLVKGREKHQPARNDDQGSIRFPLPYRWKGRGRERFLLVQWDLVLDQLISQTPFDPLIPERKEVEILPVYSPHESTTTRGIAPALELSYLVTSSSLRSMGRDRDWISLVWVLKSSPSSVIGAFR